MDVLQRFVRYKICIVLVSNDENDVAIFFGSSRRYSGLCVY